MKAYLLSDGDSDSVGVILASNKNKAWQRVYKYEQEMLDEHLLTKTDIRQHYTLENIDILEE